MLPQLVYRIVLSRIRFNYKHMRNRYSYCIQIWMRKIVFQTNLTNVPDLTR